MGSRKQPFGYRMTLGEITIQPEAADKTAAAVGEWMRRYMVPAYDEATGKGLVRHVYVRVNRKGESLCCVVINGRPAPREPELAAGSTARRSSRRSAPPSSNHSPSFSIRFLQVLRMAFTCSAASGQSTIFLRPAAGKGMGRAARAAAAAARRWNSCRA